VTKIYRAQREVALVPDVMFHELPPKISGVAFRECTWPWKCHLVPGTGE
jgi:hypothetical protein